MANPQRQNNQRPDKNYDSEERGPRQRRGGQRERGTHIGNLAGASGEGFTFFQQRMAPQEAVILTFDAATGKVTPGADPVVEVTMVIRGSDGTTRRRKAMLDLRKTGDWGANTTFSPDGKMLTVRTHPAHHTSMDGLPVPVGGKIHAEKSVEITDTNGKTRTERQSTEIMVKSDKVLALVFVKNAVGRLQAARSDVQLEAELIHELNFSEISRRQTASATGRGGIAPELFALGNVPLRSRDTRFSGASMALPSYQMQQQLRMEELLTSYAAPKEVIEASVGGLAAIKALFTESAEITNWAHTSGFLGKLEAGKLEFPEVTVESGAVWLWEPEGLTANRVIGVEIGADRLRFMKGTLTADKPGSPAVIEGVQKKWAAQLERCDREYAEAQSKRRSETIRRNLKTADALGLTSISFS